LATESYDTAKLDSQQYPFNHVQHIDVRHSISFTEWKLLLCVLVVI